jgi:hypothetical protein
MRSRAVVDAFEIDATHDATIREYCRVERCGDSETRLGNRNCSGLRCAVAIQADSASRVCSGTSNCTGRCVFFCMTIAREAT